MENIIVRNINVDRDYERPMQLSIGMLILHCDSETNTIRNVYQVTPYRCKKDQRSGLSEYCSLINLDTGKIEFDEPCSKNTTEARVLSHICKCGKYCTPQSWSEKVNGSYLREYRKGCYNIIIEVGSCDKKETTEHNK